MQEMPKGSDLGNYGLRVFQATKAKTKSIKKIKAWELFSHNEGKMRKIKVRNQIMALIPV